MHGFASVLPATRAWRVQQGGSLVLTASRLASSDALHSDLCNSASRSPCDDEHCAPFLVLFIIETFYARNRRGRRTYARSASGAFSVQVQALLDVPLHRRFPVWNALIQDHKCYTFTNGESKPLSVRRVEHKPVCLPPSLPNHVLVCLLCPMASARPRPTTQRQSLGQSCPARRCPILCSMACPWRIPQCALDRVRCAARTSTNHLSASPVQTMANEPGRGRGRFSCAHLVHTAHASGIL
ncbi:hypothetical protein C8Q77DRAFT_456680 [Trametes polyzona]|nr:hypothetical protein C8Q77DRAFT_456680 [Trametes polyzona]